MPDAGLLITEVPLILSDESTAQEVLARIQETQMAQVRAKAEAAAAAVNLPSFYNPMSVNAAKLAEQQQKRKLLWSKKSDPENEAKEVGSSNSFMNPLLFSKKCRVCAPSLRIKVIRKLDH